MPNLSALNPLNTAKADVFTGVDNDWDWLDEVLFDGRFPIKKIWVSYKK